MFMLEEQGRITQSLPRHSCNHYTYVDAFIMCYKNKNQQHAKQAGKLNSSKQARKHAPKQASRQGSEEARKQAMK